MRVLGIDPGSGRWGFAFMEEGFISESKAVQTSLVKADPTLALDLAKRAQLIVGPSGYGCPLKKVSDLDENDFYEILLKRSSEGKVVGVEAVLRLFKENRLNAYAIPGVKLLPTVAEEKKRGKIDMGTPDKLCAAVAGIVDQARRLELHYSETSFILAEIGFGFDAFVAVENGRIIDGIGGTMASSTWRGEDGEILYLKGKAAKEELRKGPIDLEKERAGAISDISKLSEGFTPREILVSGLKAGGVIGPLKQKFNSAVPLNTCDAGNAAYGAAIIADGLAGGRFKEIIDLIQIENARGSNLDYVDL